MKLNYQCPICGTPLGYEGLCWKCKSEQDRQSVMNWTAEQIKEKQELLIRNIQRLADMEDPEFTIFWQLLSYRNAITHMVDILVLDGRDERLKFLGLDGILTATCCPNCVGFLKGPAFNSFTLDGDVEVFPSELFDGEEKMDCYVRPEDYKALADNLFVLGKMSVPLFYGAASEDVNTIGGFANWVQDWEYTTCPHCGKPMKYLAQIQWDTLFDGTEGTLYIEFCPDCKIVSMQHQQT